MSKNAIKINPRDNVVVATREIKLGGKVVGSDIDLVANADIPPSHKVALVQIPENERSADDIIHHRAGHSGGIPDSPRDKNRH